MWIWAAGVAIAADAARTDATHPASPAELDAARRYEARTCGLGWGVAFPGVSRFCVGRPVEGATLVALSIGQIGVGTAMMASGGYPSLPLVGVRNLWATGIGLTALDVARARHRRYTPTEDLGELVSAPFRPAVLENPGVWLGAPLLLAGSLALTFGTRDVVRDRDAQPNVLGLDLDPALGYPLAVAVGAQAMLGVAVTEEVVFRGVLQSALSRATDPVAGWVLGTVVFTAAHAPNALGLPAESRVWYLTRALPYIALTGAVIGHVYRTSGFSLGAPVAIHFWYDAVLTGVQFVVDPDDNPISARVTVPF